MFFKCLSETNRLQMYAQLFGFAIFSKNIFGREKLVRHRETSPASAACLACNFVPSYNSGGQKTGNPTISAISSCQKINKPTNMELFLKYYTLDWLAMALSLVAVYLLGNKNKYGFISFSMANTLWIFLGFFLMNSLGIGIGNIIFLIMNIRGFISWNKKPDTNG